METVWGFSEGLGIRWKPWWLWLGLRMLPTPEGLEIFHVSSPSSRVGNL